MHEHTVTTQDKIIKIGSDKFYQVLKRCSGCRRQLSKRVTEIRKDSWHVRTH